MSLQYYQQVSNRYKEFLGEMTIDYCNIMNPKASTTAIGLANTFFSSLKQEIIRLFTEGQKIPRICPIPPVQHLIWHDVTYLRL